MHRHPTDYEQSFDVPEQAFAGSRRREASQSSHGVEPFYASGGMAYWLTVAADNFYPNEAGVQLVSEVYIPKGRQAFIKEIRVAPYCPSPLCDPWTTSGVANYQASWREWNRTDQGEESPLPQMGDLWRLPMGWEAAWDDTTTTLPSWKWSLRFYQGDVAKLRGQGYLNIPPFDTGDATSWYLVPNFPVPASAYPAGLPGAAAGPQWAAQRLQVLPTDKMNVHIPVPGDTTILLFAQWEQSDVMPRGQDIGGVIDYGSRIPPIGPSIGSLLGYMQAATSKAALSNLEHGWGG